MVRWSDVDALLMRAGARSIAASASNWASLGDGQALARLEADAARWERFLEHESRPAHSPARWTAARTSCSPPRRPA